jgi:amino acid adenylation domain-containing protein
MTVRQLLSTLRDRNIHIWVEGDKLLYSSPPGKLTPELSADLKEHKEHILLLLKAAGDKKNLHITIPPASREQRVSLSYAQERLWFFSNMDPQSASYNVLSAMRLTGELNKEALQLSLDEIVRRHEVLRTTFAEEGGRPVQVINPAQGVLIRQLDLADIPEPEREAKAKGLLGEESRKPFDLAAGPLLRVFMLRLTELEHILLITIHHIAYDGWSSGVFLRELSVLYEAYTKGEKSPLPELTIQYADYSVWQRQWLQGEVLEKQLSYWREKLQGAPPVLELPMDRPRPAIQTFRGARQTFSLDRELGEGLKDLCKRENVTLFMALLAAFKVLMFRYSGQDDIVIGIPIANRTRVELEEMIGFFVNSLVLRTDLSGAPAFRELLGRIRATTLEAYGHQDLPFERLVEELKPQRDMSHSAIFQVMFALQNAPDFSMVLPDLTVQRVEVDNLTSKVDLVFTVKESREGLQASANYNTDLFDAGTIKRMFEHYEVLLKDVVLDPALDISRVNILTGAEQHQLLKAWNDTKREYPGEKCIHHLFEEQTEKGPDSVAILYEDEQLIYRELNCRANQIAYYLKEVMGGDQGIIGMCMERSIDFVVGLLGILKAGAAYLPLDPAYPKERLDFMIQDSGMKVILTNGKFKEIFRGSAAVVLNIDEVLKSGYSIENPCNAISPQNMAYVIYTSGTTGRPKGVLITHKAVVSLSMDTEYIKILPQDRIANASNVSFDAATFEIWAGLLNGACLVVIGKNVLLSPADLAETLKRKAISVLFLTTALFNQMAHESLAAFSSIRHLLFGGETVDIGSVRKILEEGPPERLLHVYGPTESTTFTSWYQVVALPETAVTVPIGRPLSNKRIYILDRNLQPVPAGIPGELFIGGDGLSPGYLNRPELTAEKFINDPFSTVPGSRLYRTGDLARYLPDGNIEFIGRLDLQVKVRGFRIEPGEIETILCQHPRVSEAVVVAREDQPGEKRLAAYVVLKEKAFMPPEEMRGFLKEKLPEYLIPSFFMFPDKLPLTPNGKIDRKALTNGDIFRDVHENEYLQPETPAEKVLAGIWQEVLATDRIGVNDNFFELGGHSLKIFKVFSRIEQELGRKLQPSVLFKCPTIKGLAAFITNNEENRKASPIVPMRTGGSLPPLFVIAPVGNNVMCYTNLVKYLSDKHPVYGIDSSTEVFKSSVENIVKSYITEIREIVPEGPFYLIGYSSAGTIACEMARQLRHMGFDWPFVALLDSISHRHYRNKITWRKPDTVLRFLKNLPFWFYYYWLHTDNRLSQTKMRLGEIFGHIFVPQSDDPSVAYQKNSKRVIEWLQRFDKEKYPGCITLFKAKAQVLFSPASFDKGWKDLAGTVDVHVVPGHHALIMKEPYVRTLAEAINQELQRKGC